MKPSSLAPSARALCVALWILAMVTLLAGCSVPRWSFPEPWVKPYERERLADPVMKFQRDGLSDKHFEHVREVREGSRGGTGVQGGGCGCN
ncbi:MAG: DUF4266 domain-containing protein [Burkholderiaceae bacterium]|nr:DUF4266 domain-containing protein [Burkholderiaceae bacterium]